MSDVVLRRAVAADEAALVLCIDAAYAEAAARLPDLPAVSAGVAQSIAQDIVWVVLKADHLCGAIFLAAEPSHLHVMNLVVDPGFSGQGLGRRLLHQAQEQCVALGLATLQLATHVEMPGNLSLYRHLGWQETGRQGNRVFFRKQV